MKTLHFDCFAGISGDMALGAFVDLGVEPALLQSELAKLGLEGWRLDFVRDERGGISGTHAIVVLEGETGHIAPDQEEHEASPPAHHHHHHDHHHHEEEDHHYGEGHGHHAWGDIRRLIEGAQISEGAKGRALDIFRRIAGAEAQVHGVPVDEVRFHEVGALDSIIDIVGAAVCLDILRPERITCGEIELGGGTVRCAHGILPVPAPATLLLCQGLPVKTGGFSKEMTTPTGAAILASVVDEFIEGERFVEIKTGYGIGTRRMDKPNLLRLSWRETSGSASSSPSPWQCEDLTLIEAAIDDMTGEALGFLMERLFEARALDVTYSPCGMKKGRPGTIVSVLCPPLRLDDLRRTLFEHSTTIGFREIPVRRLSLRREEDRIQGAFGEARRKTVFYGDQALRSKIEYEDRARLAREAGISLSEAESRIAGKGSAD